MNYREAVNWLDQLQLFTIKLGLDTTRTLLAELGNPQEKVKIIHIAGTNGKGSVGATLLSILSTAGIRAGFYSSPHLSSVRERFRIGDRYISETDFAALVTRLAAFLHDRSPPTYFEFATILALLWFAEQQAGAVILETGMGGRLDATNVVTPLVSIITDISYDHEQHLGSTLNAIAAEKAGIIKPGVPVVFSGRAAEIIPVIAARCRGQQSPLFVHGRHFAGAHSYEGGFHYQSISGSLRPNLPLALCGSHQAINTSLALAALELLDPIFLIPSQALTIGLQQVRWPGRMELIFIQHQAKTLRFLLDGAHNEAGVAALVLSLRQGFPRRRLFLVWGNMADKAMGTSFPELMGQAAEIILTRAESQRSANPAVLYEMLMPQDRTKARCAETVEQALEIIKHIADPDDLVCVAGSLYLVGRVRQLLAGELVK
jgi:dihydrofolate synthase/folylpolyglutamate synthase